MEISEGNPWEMQSAVAPASARLGVPVEQGLEDAVLRFASISICLRRRHSNSPSSVTPVAGTSGLSRSNLKAHRT